MYRMELKALPSAVFAAIFAAFLMYRMELKVSLATVKSWMDRVPNVPYGVERKVCYRHFSNKFLVPNVPYGVERSSHA